MKPNLLFNLSNELEGELHYDDLMKRLYATDASVYRKLPLAVAIPKSIQDLKALIEFASNNGTSLIPRGAGTSLAGQCVGEGIVVDVSKYFNKILSLDIINRTVTVEPGVIRDELNNYLKPYNLFFGPNTSTSNRCMIGGMVGNNSSGTTSIKYGVTRDKVLELKTLLSDGSEVIFKALSQEEVLKKATQSTLEGKIYQTLITELSPLEIQTSIANNYPKPDIHRRNTGYAIDKLINSNAFSESANDLNLCDLLSGSEGTLAFTTQITLQLEDIPPVNSIMVACHFQSIEQCLKAVEPLMVFDLDTCEMMDDTILNLTKYNKSQEENRFFVSGNPKAILLCELRDDSTQYLEQRVEEFIETLKSLELAYAYPTLRDSDIDKALELRKAGLGLLGNMVGDKKAVACIEDTAVALKDLSSYIKEFTHLMKSFNQEAVYYAHAGAGELHLRPILNLKSKEDVVLFREITTAVAHLVKKYKGSFSGEHGDGIVRAEFIPLMIGQENYELLERIKTAFDPNNIFNPGKIVKALPMDKNLRTEIVDTSQEIKTKLDFSASQGILREAEKCNGSGDCRKLQSAGGVMCPSYRATRNEKDTTRARANALREYLTTSDQQNKFDYEELKDVFDLCLSCKACASECPSSVDVAALKAEFLYQYQKANGVSFRTKLFAYNNKVNSIFSPLAALLNWSFKTKLTSKVIKSVVGIAQERSLPTISKKSFVKQSRASVDQIDNKIKTVYLFADEFTNYLDTSVGLDAIDLLQALHYEVKILDNFESGRAMISKGLLEEAKNCANKNVALFKNLVSEETPLIGIEPSAILTFKDEYLKLANDRVAAKDIAQNTYMIEAFLQKEFQQGNIDYKRFTKEPKTIKFHGHCYQKALDSVKTSFDVLNIPKNYKVTIIPSGCCGMAGSFGYEKEHYEISMQIGEQTLFPAIRKASKEIVISANGTSCRHQIKDGTGVESKHPITILKEALI